MTVISKSLIDPRNLSLALIGIGGTPLVIGIINLNWILILAGMVILTIGILVLFFGKSTFSVAYNNKSETFTLSSRQANLTVNKPDVLDVRQRFTFFQLMWPLPRPYYYVLKAKNDKSYKFVIWSNQPNLKSNYKMLERSVATWNKNS
jgi:hypothetical protein